MDYETILRDSFGISEVLLQESREVTAQCREMFDKIDEVRGYNQLKVLQAFRDAQIAPMHFAPTYGYGYSDAGREKLEELFAAVFRSEDAIVRPQIASARMRWRSRFTAAARRRQRGVAYRRAL